MSADTHIVTPTPEGFTQHVVAHHFDSAEQEFQASKFAFWLFLATEIMLFGGLFAGYILYHGVYPETFRVAGDTLQWELGALNTVVLLTSSWTMALGVRAAQLSQKRKMLTWLSLTIALAGVFMVVKYIEYSGKLGENVGPGMWFNPVAGGHYAEALAGVPFPNLFFSFYFTMTGIHGIHVLVGMGLITWLVIRGTKGHFHSGYYTPVDLIGLYWHIVDIIWIFLFPLLYLVP